MNILTSKVPKFDMVLPITKQKIEYRPFLVKEEKLLIMANDSQSAEAIIKTVGDIVSNCTFGAIDIKTAPMFVTQYAFLQIRGKSIGEKIDFTTICGNKECEHKQDMNISIEDFKIIQTPGHSNKIDLDNGIMVEMKYPTLEHFAKLFESNDPNAIFDIVAESIDRLVTEEEVVINTPDLKLDMLEFVDNLTPAQFENIQQFVVTMPVLSFASTYPCPSCGTPNEVLINGINHFFG